MQADSLMEFIVRNHAGVNALPSWLIDYGVKYVARDIPVLARNGGVSGVKAIRIMNFRCGWTPGLGRSDSGRNCAPGVIRAVATNEKNSFVC